MAAPTPHMTLCPGIGQFLLVLALSIRIDRYQHYARTAGPPEAPDTRAAPPRAASGLPPLSSLLRCSLSGN